MGYSRITLLLSVGSLLSANALMEAPKPKAEASATVTVTAEAEPIEIAKTPNPVKVMDAKGLEESGAQSLDQVLPELLPGQFISYGGPGSLSNLYLGASRATDVVVVLDGIRITDPSGSGANFSSFSLGGIDRVEVLQGPSSTRYGSDTHGGVVSLSSAGGVKRGFSGSANLGLGTRDTRKGEFAPAYGWDGGWLRMSASGEEQEQSLPADKPFRTVTSVLNLGQQVGQDGLLTATYRNHYSGTPLPFGAGYDSNWQYTPVFAPKRQSQLRDEDAIAAYRVSLNSTWLLETSFGHVVQNRMEPGMDLSSPASLYRGQRNQGLASLTWTPFKGFQTNGLLDFNQENALSSGNGATGSHKAAALETSWELDSGLRAVASGRYQQDSIQSTPQGKAALSSRDTNQFVYKFGLNWLSASGLRLYASYGTSYNTPTLYSLTYNQTHTGGTDLQNEKSRSLLAGITWKQGPWTAKLEGSRSWYDQVIYWKDLGNWAGIYANGTNLRIQGLEGSLGYEASGWQLEGFVRSQEARNTSQPEAQQFSAGGATGRPFFIGGLRSSVRIGDWRLQGRWSYVGSSYMYFDEASSVEGTRTHFNDVALALAWTPLKAWTFTARGEHLMQKAWSKEEWLGGELLRKNDAYLVPTYPAQGPTLTLEANFRF